MLNVNYFNVGDRGVSLVQLERRFGANTIPYKPISKYHTEERYQSILRELMNRALSRGNINIESVSQMAQSVMSFVEETPPMKRLMEIIDIIDKSGGPIPFIKNRAIKLAEKKKMFSNTVMNGASAYVGRLARKNVNVNSFAPGDFASEVASNVEPQSIDVQEIVEKSGSSLANNVSSAMRIPTDEIVPNGEIPQGSLEQSFDDALHNIISGNNEEPKSNFSDIVISSGEVDGVVNHGEAPRVIIYPDDGKPEAVPVEEPRVIIYPDDGKPEAVPVEEPRVIIYPDDRKPEVAPVEEPRVIIYPDDREEQDKNIRGGVVAPDRDEGKVVGKNSIHFDDPISFAEMKEQALRLKKENESNSSSISDLENIQNQTAQRDLELKKIAGDREKEARDAWMKYYQALQVENDKLLRKRQSIQSNIDGLYEQIKASENSIAGYDEELAELQSMMGGKSR